ncbi:MAG: hypothetical protein DLM69_09240 [Candidatus Chloroheliales bacterium]|nr:MAG: hypothetical protein DLM69_09240 [Chloroflexota bacterium]
MENPTRSQMVSIPLRIFLGIIFFFAGLDKITDPTFFDPKNANYIGAQLQGFVTYNHSPLSFLLTSIAIPNATLFGALMAVAEMACGLLVLLGLFTRAAAGLGLLLSTTLWLTASWGQQPFYTGWDLPYIFGWLTLLLLGAGRYSLDEWRASQRHLAPAQAQADQERRRFLVQAGASVGAIAALLIAGSEVFAGFANRSQQAANTGTATAGGAKSPASGGNPMSNSNPTSVPTTDTSNVASLPAPTNTPPPAAPMLSAPTDTPIPATTNTPAPAAPTNTPVLDRPVNPAPSPTAAAPANGTLIAHASDVPVGSGLLFTAPDTGDDSYLVHLSDGRFVGFDAICTHAGCTVNYDQQNTIFFCPCHGAEFDPTNNGAVLRRPARSPLAKLNISVDQASGNVYYLGQSSLL